MIWLPVVLVIRVLSFPDMPPVAIERFATEDECKVAKANLFNNSPLQMSWLSCEVDWV